MARRGGRRGGGRSSRSSKSRSRSSSRSSGGSKSGGSKSGGSKSSGGSSSKGGSGSSRSSRGSSSSSRSSGVSSVSSAKQTASISKTSPSMSSSMVGGHTLASVGGDRATYHALSNKKMLSPATSKTYGSFIGATGKTVKIKGVDPSSAEGKTIQATYDRQRMVKALNTSKQNMTTAMRKAGSAQEAIKIREKFVSQNPALSSAGNLRQQTKRVNKALQTGFTNLGPTGDPISVTTTRKALYDSTGKMVGSTTGGSVGTKSDFFETKKLSTPKKATTQKPVFDMTLPVGKDYDNLSTMPTMALTSSEPQFLSESQKAFGFMPSPSEIKGDDPFSQLGQGALKGSSNIMASFWNIGESVRAGVTQTEAKPVGYYGTPITRAELTFFGVAEKGLKGEYKDTDQAGSDVQKGLSGAGKEFQTDFFGSVGSLVEAGPYIIGGGIAKGVQAGTKIGTGFFKVSKTSKADDLLKLDTAKPLKKDYFDGFFRDTKRGLGIGTTKTGKVTKAKFTKDSLDLGRGLGMQGTPKQATTGFFGKTTTPKKLTKKAYDDSLGKNFFTTGKGQQLIQVAKTEQKALTKTKQIAKTKQVPKTKAVTAQSFFKPVKVKAKVKAKAKTKQRAGLAFFPPIKTAAKSKTQTPLKQRAKQAAMFGIPAAATAITTSTLFPPTTTGGGGGGGGVPAWLTGKRGGGGNRKRKGKSGYYGWNIDIGKVGGTLGGPAYVTSRSASEVDRYLSVKGKKARRKKQPKANGLDFFG